MSGHPPPPARRPQSFYAVRDLRSGEPRLPTQLGPGALGSDPAVRAEGIGGMDVFSLFGGFFD
jgi:hypothetical protein